MAFKTKYRLTLACFSALPWTLEAWRPNGNGSWKWRTVQGSGFRVLRALSELLRAYSLIKVCWFRVYGSKLWGLVLMRSTGVLVQTLDVQGSGIRVKVEDFKIEAKVSGLWFRVQSQCKTKFGGFRSMKGKGGLSFGCLRHPDVSNALHTLPSVGI